MVGGWGVGSDTFQDLSLERRQFQHQILETQALKKEALLAAVEDQQQSAIIVHDVVEGVALPLPWDLCRVSEIDRLLSISLTDATIIYATVCIQKGLVLLLISCTTSHILINGTHVAIRIA